VRAIGRDEVQPDPAARLGQPVLHKLGVMVAGIVQKDVDYRQMGYSAGVSLLRRCCASG